MEFMETDEGLERDQNIISGNGQRLEGSRIQSLEMDEGGKGVSGCKDLRQVYSALCNPRGKGNAYPDRTKQALKSKRGPLQQHQTTDRKVYNNL